ncbi:MAG: FAD-dependent thymidylate synthase [Candidatus Sericytochromatia bacterium]
MARIVVPEAEALLDKELPVLDKGFVRLVDYMGGDARVVQSARVSYGAGTKTVREDAGLINYLMRNLHTSPFEQISLVFHIKLPLFVFAQMVRHRTAKLNSMSARYSVMEDEFYLPEPANVRGQSATNKQVGEGEVDGAEAIAGVFAEVCRRDYGIYEDLLNQGVAREQARMVLPQNLYTQIYWKCDMHNLFHFLRLRLDWHAQQEIRAYGEAMARCAQAVAPLCYEAFEEHILHAQRFSRTEMDALRALLRGETHSLSERVAAEFDKKLWGEAGQPTPSV